MSGISACVGIVVTGGSVTGISDDGIVVAGVVVVVGFGAGVVVVVVVVSGFFVVVVGVVVFALFHQVAKVCARVVRARGAAAFGIERREIFLIFSEACFFQFKRFFLLCLLCFRSFLIC